ncbi:hypothetical protein FNH22_12405 [Fulvivirga sp. M361]|uniref:Ig-like domain-containing domain n=1 Tax=Fulvivirga sp. M361 TaxID=2594266 RepID=UPI00117B8E1E|nr:Ig-like domain-containing domain [Fulvivirga sp. M361]TRX58674.1 hypothetical protein FNH22_12405 [Fulvivirga sp. M361]
MQLFLRLLISLFLIITMVKCANQSQPTGGPKDEEPPVLIDSDPKQSELDVTTNKVEVAFNERIKLNNPKEQLIITPRIDAEYTVKYNKDRVIFTFEQDLPDSTTFTFNFREAIQDITEGNAPENLKLAFSTGDYLDSISIAGQIRNLLTNETGKDITVALYQLLDTLDIFTGPPLYFTKTDEEGNYQFDNIKIDQYRVRAYNDKNKNLTAESKSESYSFLSNTLELDTSIQNLDLSHYSLDSRPLELQNARQSGTVYIIKFNKSVTDYELITLEPDLILSSNFTDATQNTIQIFNTFPIVDSLFLYIKATDSLDQATSDTTYLKFEETKRKPADFKPEYQLEDVITDVRVVKGSIRFQKPVRDINYDSTLIFIDSLHIYPFRNEHFTWNKYRDYLEFNYILDKALFEKPKDPPKSQKVEPDTSQIEKSKPQVIKPYLLFGQQAFTSVEQDSSQQFKQDLSFRKPDDFGTIFVTIDTEQPSYIVQLLNSSNTVVKEKTSTSEFQFNYVPAGNYRIRILIDSNENGQWDIGNIWLNEEPEPVFFYTTSTGEQEITMRANFEIVPDPIVF